MGALIAATMFISITSIQLYQEALPRLVHPEGAIHENLSLAAGVVVFSMVVALAPLIGLLRQRSRGAAAKAQLMELFNDEAGLVSVLIGILFLMNGHPIADPLAAIAVATLIAVNAFGLLRENASFLLGKSPGRELLGTVTRVAEAVPGVLDVHDLRAEYIGPETIRASMHIQVPGGMPVEEADRIAEEVQERVHAVTGCDYCIVHLDAAPPQASQRKKASGQ